MCKARQEPSGARLATLEGRPAAARAGNRMGRVQGPLQRSCAPRPPCRASPKIGGGGGQGPKGCGLAAAGGRGGGGRLVGSMEVHRRHLQQLEGQKGSLAAGKSGFRGVGGAAAGGARSVREGEAASIDYSYVSRAQSSCPGAPPQAPSRPSYARVQTAENTVFRARCFAWRPRFWRAPRAAPPAPGSW